MSSSVLIGSGTYGKVFSISQTEVKKVMSLIYAGDGLGDPDGKTLNECIFLSTFSHIPFIPRAIKIEIDLQKEKVNLIENNVGPDLCQYVKTTTYLDRLRLLSRVMCQMARILLWLKQIRVAHIDITPMNLCLARDNNHLTLIDWGFVTPIHRYTPCVHGTCTYTDPNCLFKKQIPTYRFDMFSMGMTLCFYLRKRHVDFEQWKEPCDQHEIFQMTEINKHRKQMRKHCPNGDGLRLLTLIHRMLDVNEETRITPFALYSNSVFRDLWGEYPLEEMAPREEIPVSNELVQTDITSRMINIVIDWLIHVTNAFKLHASLGLAIKLIYRFRRVSINRSKLQLVGISCLYLGGMIQVGDNVKVSDLAYICDHAYDRTEIIEMIQTILETLNYQIYPIQAAVLKHIYKRL